MHIIYIANVLLKQINIKILNYFQLTRADRVNKTMIK